MTTLLLDRRDVELSLDGQRVVIREPDARPRTVPLTCAERGVTVTFLQPDGAVRGVLFGAYTRRREALWQRLRDFMDRPDWPARYEDWRRSVDSYAHRALCKRLGLEPDQCQLTQVQAHLQHQLGFRVGGAQRDFIVSRLQGFATGLATELLRDSGLAAKALRRLDRRLDLTGVLTRWLVLDLQWPLLAWLKRQPSGKPLEDRDLVAFFESRGKRLQWLGERILSRLHRFLVEL